LDYKGTAEEYSWLTAADLKNATELVAEFHYYYSNKPGLLFTPVLTVRAAGHKTPGESSVNITVSSYDTTHL